MKRYQFKYGRVENDEDEHGEHVLYEEARQIEIDRGTKAANLQLLAKKVLDYKELVEAAVGGPHSIDAYETERQLGEVFNLARSLKQ